MRHWVVSVPIEPKFRLKQQQQKLPESQLRLLTENLNRIKTRKQRKWIRTFTSIYISRCSCLRLRSAQSAFPIFFQSLLLARHCLQCMWAELGAKGLCYCLQKSADVLSTRTTKEKWEHPLEEVNRKGCQKNWSFPTWK